MSDIVIRAEGLGKRYRIGRRERYMALRDTVTEALSAPFRRLRGALRGEGRTAREGEEDDTIWAIRDVSFELRRGEVLGIVGGNGAGKSTLLKVLSRITEPTEGRAEIRGRVRSLLEVGTGFHPELTGRENIFLNGAILGMSRAEIVRKFDEIVDFAEVEKFIDTPVKHFSSGMYMRLAFAVAANMEPEILIIDEVLAVGDDAFQKKCLGRIGSVAKSGKTVIFVSHNTNAVTSLCTQGMWLKAGRMMGFRGAKEIVSMYLRSGGGTGGRFDVSRCPRTREFELVRACVRQGGSTEGPFLTSQPFEIEIEYVLKQRLSGLRVGADVSTLDGTTLWQSFDDDMEAQRPGARQPGRYVAVCSIPENLFKPQQYAVSLSIGVHGTGWITVSEIRQVVEFYNVCGVNAAYGDERLRVGVLLPGLRWLTSEAEPEELYQSANG